MTPEEIMKYKKSQPFHPVRVFVSDGSTYDVLHPSFIIVSRSEVVIGLSKDADQIPPRTVHLNLSDVVRVEPLKAKKSGKRRKPRV